MTSEKKYSIVAVNKRLYDAGLLDDFYKAATKKDKDVMVALLMSVELERSQAEETIDTILESPASFEF
jgi:hypothetical protein